MFTKINDWTKHQQHNTLFGKLEIGKMVIFSHFFFLFRIFFRWFLFFRFVGIFTWWRFRCFLGLLRSCRHNWHQVLLHLLIDQLMRFVHQPLGVFDTFAFGRGTGRRTIGMVVAMIRFHCGIQTTIWRETTCVESNRIKWIDFSYKQMWLLLAESISVPVGPNS